jgi:hypothetical protein
MKTVKSASIDCKAFPSIPQGWSVLEHRSFGEVFVTDGKLQGYKLICAPCQQNLLPPVCDEIEKEIKEVSAPVFNVNVLDFLLEHQEAITEEMRQRIHDNEKDPAWYHGIWFWGTVYKDEKGFRCIRGLSLDKDGKYESTSVRIDHDGLLGDPMIVHDWFQPPE